MNTLGLTFLNTAVQASYLVLALVLVRLIFKKAPRKLLCALWALVGLRLIFPFSLSSVFSLLPSRTPVAASSDVGGLYVQSGLPMLDHAVNTVLQTAAAPTAPTQAVAEQTAINWGSVLTVVWLCGVCLLALYAIVSYLRLRLQVREAVKAEDGVWLCDKISSPFILGVVRPRIYLPSDAAEGDRPLILAHERAPLKRRDQLWKPLGFVLLTLYWFNPVLWVAYVLLCRDIELACDERVLQEQGSEIKKAYAEALLRCSSPKHLVRACPVAFGETGVKGRIKSVLNYKKPAFWVILLALIASAVVAVCFMTIPKERAPAVVTVLNTGSDSKAVTVQPESVSLDRQTLRLKVTYVNTGDQPIEANETVWMLREADGAYAPLEVRNNDWDTTLRFQLPAQEQQTYNYTPSAFCDCTAPGAYRFQAHFRFADEPENSYPHLLWFDFKITSPEEPNALVPLPDGMDQAIHEVLLADNAEGYWGGECATEGHVVYGCEQNGITWTVYLYHGFERYGFINGYFTDVSGHWSVAVLTMELRDAGFICKQIDYPRDGSENASSIKRLFPKKLEHRALNPTQSDSDEVTRQCEAQAGAYLKTIGREAAVVPYHQLNLQLPNLTAEVSNKLTNELGRMEGLYELTLGTREQLENGVRYVYRTSYLEAQNELLFTKERYDTQEVVESYLADATTGEWLKDLHTTDIAQDMTFFDATIIEVHTSSIVVTVTASPDDAGVKPDAKVELSLKDTGYAEIPPQVGWRIRVIYEKGTLFEERYPLGMTDFIRLEVLEAVEWFLDGKVTSIDGDWATVSPFRTDTQLPLYGDLVRVATKPEVKGSPIKLEVGKSYRIVFLLKDISGSNPAVINPAQTFYAYDDISSGGKVALVTPTGPGVDPATSTTTKQEPTTTQWTTSTPPTTTAPPTTTKKPEPTTTKATEPPSTSKAQEPATTRAYTPEEAAAIRVLGEEAVERFPDLKNTTNSYLEKAYVLMNRYPKFKKANVKSYDIRQDGDGYQNVTLHTDKGDFVAKYDGMYGVCLSNNQETREYLGIEYYFPDINKPENVQMLSLYRAYYFMMQEHVQFQGAFVQSFDELVEEDKITVTLHTDKGDCTAVLGPTGKFISTSVSP